MDKEFFESLDRKIDKLNENQMKLVIEQIEIKHDLKDHIQRTQYNEERIEFIEDKVKPVLESIRFTKWIFSGVCFVSSLVLAYLKYKSSTF